MYWFKNVNNDDQKRKTTTKSDLKAASPDTQEKKTSAISVSDITKEAGEPRNLLPALHR